MRGSPRTSILAATLLASFTAAHAEDFLGQEGDLWRASKLVGVIIYGPDKKKVGDINDVLMGRDGKAAYVVVGVGGILGIGEKNVAIPFDKVSFSQEPLEPSSPPPAADAGATASGNAGAGLPVQRSGGSAGMAPSTSGTEMTGAPIQARSTAYPDHGTVTYSADQLKAAPTFTYAK